MLGDPDRARRWLIRFLAACAVVGGLAFAPRIVSGGDGKLARLRGELHRVKTQVHEREAANADKRRSVHALKNDDGAVEDIARGELGMTFPGELVIRVEAGR
jgi:cell division protein FtsB